MSQATELIASQFATGAQNAKDWGSAVYNVRTFGAKGDGATDDVSFINSAITKASSLGGGTVFFPSSTYVTSSFTVPSNVTLWFANGAKLSINNGATVAINGPVTAGLHQIFSGLGNIAGSIKVPSLFPQWWGAKADGVNDDTNPIKSAMNTAYTGCKKVEFPAGTYIISSTLPSVADSMVFCGEGMKNTIISPNGNFDAFTITHNDIEIYNFLIGPNFTQTDGNAVKITNSSGHKIHHLTMSTFSGIFWDRGSNGFINNLSFSSIKGVAIQLESTTAAGSQVGIYIDTVAAGGVTGSAGIMVGSGCSGIYISKCDMLTFGNGILINNRTAGAAAPVFVFFNTVLGDSAFDNGFRIDAGDSIYLEECWGSSAVNQGFNITGGSNIWLRGCKAINNGAHGVLIQSSGVNGNGVHLRDVDVWGNSVTTANAANGISVLPGISNFSIIGCKSGRGPRLLNQQNYGIIVLSGTSNFYTIALNNTQGNTAAGVSDGGTGTTKSVVNNI